MATLNDLFQNAKSEAEKSQANLDLHKAVTQKLSDLSTQVDNLNQKVTDLTDQLSQAAGGNLTPDQQTLIDQTNDAQQQVNASLDALQSAESSDVNTPPQHPADVQPGTADTGGGAAPGASPDSSSASFARRR